jgi:hypothetical protein
MIWSSPSPRSNIENPDRTPIMNWERVEQVNPCTMVWESRIIVVWVDAYYPMKSDGKCSQETRGSEEFRWFLGKTKIFTIQELTIENKCKQKVGRDRFKQKPKHKPAFGMRVWRSKKVRDQKSRVTDVKCHSERLGLWEMGKNGQQSLEARLTKLCDERQWVHSRRSKIRISSPFPDYLSAGVTVSHTGDCIENVTLMIIC